MQKYRLQQSFPNAKKAVYKIDGRQDEHSCEQVTCFFVHFPENQNRQKYPHHPECHNYSTFGYYLVSDF